MDHVPTNEVVLLSSQLNTLQQYINHYHKYLDHDTIFILVSYQVFQLKLMQLFLNLYFILWDYDTINLVFLYYNVPISLQLFRHIYFKF